MYFGTDIYRRSQKTVRVNECSCGLAPLNPQYLCPKCGGTRTTLNDGYNANFLYCRDCGKETAKDQHWYHYKRKCLKCGCEAQGSHMTWIVRRKRLPKSRVY